MGTATSRQRPEHVELKVYSKATTEEERKYLQNIGLHDTEYQSSTGECSIRGANIWGRGAVSCAKQS